MSIGLAEQQITQKSAPLVSKITREGTTREFSCEIAISLARKLEARAGKGSGAVPLSSAAENTLVLAYVRSRKKRSCDIPSANADPSTGHPSCYTTIS